MSDLLVTLQKKLQGRQGKTVLAAGIGLLAMLLILLSEQQTHVLLEDGTALAETIYQPQVRGVAVLCEGGDDVGVAARITELVSALLDLPSNRICVERRRT